MAHDPGSDAAQQQLETALRIARVTLDGAEKLIRLQLDSAKQAVEDSAHAAARLSEVKDVSAVFAVQNELAEHTANSLLNLSRNIYEIATHAQGELAHLAEEHAHKGQKLFVGGLESFSKASPPGTDILSSALKSTFAASQAAYESLTKAARQVNEFADASIKAASTTTSEALKGKTRK